MNCAWINAVFISHAVHSFVVYTCSSVLSVFFKAPHVFLVKVKYPVLTTTSSASVTSGSWRRADFYWRAGPTMVLHPSSRHYSVVVIVVRIARLHAFTHVYD